MAAAKAFVRALAAKVHADRDATDSRTLAQVEADVFLDLLAGRHLHTHDIVAKVELVAPVETWLAAAPSAAASIGDQHPHVRDTGEGRPGELLAEPNGSDRCDGEPGDLVGSGPPGLA